MAVPFFNLCADVVYADLSARHMAPSCRTSLGAITAPLTCAPASIRTQRRALSRPLSRPRIVASPTSISAASTRPSGPTTSTPCVLTRAPRSMPSTLRSRSVSRVPSKSAPAPMSVPAASAASSLRPTATVDSAADRGTRPPPSARSRGLHMAHSHRGRTEQCFAP